MVAFCIAALPAEYAHPKVGPLWPAGGASWEAKSRYGAPGGAYGLINGPSALGDVI